MRLFHRLVLGFFLTFAAPAIAANDTADITITTLSGRTHIIIAEIADTPAERRQGLMGRDIFAPGDAMLFVFEAPRPLSFWMKDTPVSLDIVFFDAGGHWLNTAARTTPFSITRLLSDGPALYALELSAGEAVRLGIGPGSRLVRNP